MKGALGECWVNQFIFIIVGFLGVFLLEAGPDIEQLTSRPLTVFQDIRYEIQGPYFISLDI